MTATFAWFGYELPKEDRFRLIKAAGFDGISLWWADDFGDGTYRDNPGLARGAGLTVENVHAPFERCNDIWGAAGEELLAHYLTIVSDCGEHEIPAVVIHLSSGKTPPPPNEAGLNRLQRLVCHAEGRGVRVAFENLRESPHLDFTLSRIPSAGFCFDSGHRNCWTPDEDLLTRYGERLFVLHLHDNDGSDDQHKIPFDGTVDWLDVMRKVAKSRYTGPVALEAKNTGYEDMSPEAFLALTYTRAKKLEGMRNDAVHRERRGGVSAEEADRPLSL
ncbi:MAG: sugar phosphate isomerase/epimerase [Oscillospiraceae bacterium]|jgi:sugar phosphate isomerase/epimerase|nr:sugar phosphate isomerase/epimerase [Oscillospiraceae bacterium]